MNDLNPRIRTALVSVNPTTKIRAWHGAPTALGVLRGVRRGGGCVAPVSRREQYSGNSLAYRILGKQRGEPAPGKMNWQASAKENRLGCPAGFDRRKTMEK